jgi:hypothetical protein
MFANGLNFVAYTSGAVSREIFPAGSTSSFGITPRQQRGVLAWDDEHIDWDAQQQARWMAEDGYRRFARVLGEQEVESYEPAGWIALWAGYSYRLLGENWCEAVIDGGAAQPTADFLLKAEEWFTRAIDIGGRVSEDELVTAAHAGRASVRVYLDKWTEALADAALVPAAFAFRADYNDLELTQYNRVYWSASNQPYRAHTVWNTVYEEYYLETNDPRTPWDTNPDAPTGDAAVMDLGRVPWYFTTKYPNRAADINLSTGREMRLIEAEGMLRAGDWQGAMTVINALRADVGVPAWTASSLVDAWSRLKRERGIELWLEARRLGDLRRWKAANTPGALDPLESPGPESYLSAEQTLCYPISKAERETNPNLSNTP